MHLRLAFLVALSGCAPRLGEFSCENTLWTFESPVDCSSVARNLDLAEIMFGRGARAIPVLVVSERVLPEGAYGNYDVRWGVSLDCTGLSFGHEVLHKLELDEGVMMTFAHPQWEENGNANLTQTYVNRAVPLDCEE